MLSLKERLRQEQAPLAAFLSLMPLPVVTRALAAAGADLLLLGQAHGPIRPGDPPRDDCQNHGDGLLAVIRVPRRDGPLREELHSTRARRVCASRL